VCDPTAHSCRGCAADGECGAGAPACQPEWPTFRHDAHNSGNYDVDALPPAAITDLAGAADAGGLKLSWKAPGALAVEILARVLTP